MTIATLLDQALRTSGVPIIGVSVRSESDRTTWSITFDASATQAQKDQAATVIASLATDAAAEADGDAQSSLNNKVLQAIVIWVAQKLTIAPATAKQQIVAIYKGL